MKIEVYSKSECSWCHRLYDKLDNRGLTYTILMVDESAELLQQLKDRAPGVKTVPQMFIDDKLVGGYELSSAWLDGYSYDKPVAITGSEYGEDN